MKYLPAFDRGLILAQAHHPNCSSIVMSQPRYQGSLLPFTTRRRENLEWGCVMSMMLRVTSLERLHKTQDFAPFDPKCWYNVRKIKKDNLPYVFSRVVHVRFCGVFKNTRKVIFLFLSFLHYINIWGQKLQNPILRSISTDHLNQAESRRLRTVNVWITFVCDIKCLEPVRMVYLWYQVPRRNLVPRVVLRAFP